MSTAPWTELPKELLISIANFLNDIEVLRFRAVCKPWRSSIPGKRLAAFPLRLPFPISPSDPIHPKRTGSYLSHTTTYLLEPLDQSDEASYQAMLIRVKSGKEGELYIVNPFAGDRPICFPKFTFPKILSLLDFRVKEVSKSYRLRYNNDSRDRLWWSHQDRNPLLVRRVVFSPISSETDYLIVGIYDAGSLFFMRTGDEKWTIIDDGLQHYPYEDVAVHNGKCYAVTTSGTIAVLSPSSLNAVNTISSPVAGTITGQRYLVQSEGDLYLARIYMGPPVDLEYWTPRYDAETKTYFPEFRDTRHTLRIKVYKLNEEKGMWDEVKNLEDKALFLGEDCRFLVPAKDVAGCKGNCIYFRHQHWYNKYDESLRGLSYHEIGLINFEYGAGEPLVCFRDHTKIFFPPPIWLRPVPYSFYDGADYGQGHLGLTELFHDLEA